VNISQQLSKVPCVHQLLCYISHRTTDYCHQEVHVNRMLSMTPPATIITYNYFLLCNDLSLLNVLKANKPWRTQQSADWDTECSTHMIQIKVMCQMQSLNVSQVCIDSINFQYTTHPRCHQFNTILYLIQHILNRQMFLLNRMFTPKTASLIFAF